MGGWWDGSLSTVFLDGSLDQTSCLTTAFLKTLSFCVCSLSMPINDRLGVIEVAKAYQREQQRLRTESRLAQLGQDQRELELREVLILFAFIWAVGIVLFYARLYLGPST